MILTPFGRRAYVALVWLGQDVPFSEIYKQMGTTSQRASAGLVDLRKHGLATFTLTGKDKKLWSLCSPVEKGKLTPGERATLEAVKDLGSGATNGEIAEQLNTDNSAIGTHLNALEKKHWIARSSSKAKRTIYIGGRIYGSESQCQKRNCLMCRRSFMSQHAGNRICSDCRNTEAWRQGQPVAASFWETGTRARGGRHAACVNPR